MALIPIGRIDNFTHTFDLLRRIGRRLLWPCPTLYWPIGQYRGRISDLTCDLWVGGYPRSANTFLWRFLQAALPETRIISHLHFPPLIIRQLQKGKPGVFVIRDPLKAVVSASIFTDLSLQHSLDYYVDFHHVMWRFRRDLLVTPFETITDNPHAVLKEVTTRFNFRNHNDGPLRPQTMNEVMTEIEAMPHSLNEHGQVDEMKVSRPSAQRKLRAQALELELRTSTRLQPGLVKARLLYDRFRSLTSESLEHCSPASVLGEPLPSYFNALVRGSTGV